MSAPAPTHVAVMTTINRRTRGAGGGQFAPVQRSASGLALDASIADAEPQDAGPDPVLQEMLRGQDPDSVEPPF